MPIVRSGSSTLLAAGALAVVAMVGLRSTSSDAADAAAAQATPATPAQRIAHGEYLVKTSGCDDCHTPWKMGDNGPEPDMSRRLMGHPVGLAVSDPPGLKAPWIGSASASMTSWSGPW